MLESTGQLILEKRIGSDVEKTVALINWPIGVSSDLHQPSRHRSIYLCRLRHAPPKELVAFDLPDGISVVGKRTVSTSPAHSLFFMNSPFLIEQSLKLSQLVLARVQNEDERVTEIFRRVLKRQPTKTELAQSLQFIETTNAKLNESQPDKEANEVSAYASLCQAVFAWNEFRYID